MCKSTTVIWVKMCFHKEIEIAVQLEYDGGAVDANSTH